MNTTIDWVFTILGGALTLLTVYGALTLSRKFFLSGLFFFSFIPLIGESMAYNTDKAPVHILVIALFLIQLVLALPNNITYGAENAAAGKLSGKIAVGMLIINIAGALFVLCLNSGVLAQFGYYHIAFALAIVYLMAKRMTSNGTAWLK